MTIDTKKLADDITAVCKFNEEDGAHWRSMVIRDLLTLLVEAHGALELRKQIDGSVFWGAAAEGEKSKRDALRGLKRKEKAVIARLEPIVSLLEMNKCLTRKEQ